MSLIRRLVAVVKPRGPVEPMQIRRGDAEEDRPLRESDVEDLLTSTIYGQPGTGDRTDRRRH